MPEKKFKNFFCYFDNFFAKLPEKTCMSAFRTSNVGIRYRSELMLSCQWKCVRIEVTWFWRSGYQGIRSSAITPSNQTLICLLHTADSSLYSSAHLLACLLPFQQNYVYKLNVQISWIQFQPIVKPSREHSHQT